MRERRAQWLACGGLVLVLLVAAFASLAQASVSVCVNESVADGDPNTACGANWVEHAWFEVAASELLLVCRGSTLTAGPYGADAACTDAGGQYVLSRPASFQASDLLYEFGSPHGLILAPWDLSLGEGGGAGGGGTSLVPELTTEQAMQIFGAVLLLWSVAYAGLFLRRVMERSKP